MTLASTYLFAQGTTRTIFEFMRIGTNTDWIIPVAVCVGIMLFVRYMYRRDAVDLSPAVGWLLTALRTAVFLGLLILYLQPHWRVEREEVRNSRVAVLADTSLSMGLTDADSTPTSGIASRAERVAAALSETTLIEQLRETHDVVVYRFDENLVRVASFDKLTEEEKSGNASQTEEPAGKPAGSKEKIDWKTVLAPVGAETRLGQWLRQLIRDERNSPFSGVLLLSDGGQNAGVVVEAALEAAAEAKATVVAVGIGSNKQPVNVRVSDLVAPARAYPGDRYTVTGFVQAQGLSGRVIDVQLLSRAAVDGTNSEPGTGNLEHSRRITLGADGEVLPVKFELTPDETGRRTLCFRLTAPAADSNATDNLREVDVEIVDRENRVLLFAGGPSREYRFLRPMLFRDRSTTVDILLQSGLPGMSQEADTILDEFPSTPKEMFDYDCLVAMDPDWRELDPVQVDLLERWVAEQGGGMIVIPGPVFAGSIDPVGRDTDGGVISSWIQDSSMESIRALYPIVFDRRFSDYRPGMYDSKEPWPLRFTREGLEAEFLWLDDSATASRQIWKDFIGVHSVCPARGPKPGATVLARFSDPSSGTGDKDSLPVYFAEQFYGSGRVFYIGSGEMWRLRRVGDTYFDRFYTKLIRHVSQGRLLRGSSRGVLLVGRDRYLLGDTVELRAQLTNARLDPLELPSVPLQVIRPDGTLQTVELLADSARTGTYAGQFIVDVEGSCRLELPIPESENERLARRIQVKVPDLEREDPQRNDALLGRIAEGTGGKYYAGLGSIFDAKAAKTLVGRFKDRTENIIRPAKSDPQWEEEWLRWAMYIIVGLLCLEWLIRRLLKLA
ncbi:MAG: hypothetical protein V3V75_07765 [Thermoguttaceae bacterium]